MYYPARPTFNMAITILSHLLFVALCAAAIAFASPVKVREPFVTLPLARHFNATGPIPMAQKDQERIQALVQGAQGNAQRRNIESTSLVLSPQDFYYTVQVLQLYLLFYDRSILNCLPLS